MTERAELDIEWFTDGPDIDEKILAAAEWLVDRFNLDSLRVSVSLVDDATIRQQNCEQLGHDWATDVISFVIERDGDAVDGEVIASVDTARRLADQARLVQNRQWTIENELLLYVVHGMLHVVGLDDIEDDDRQQMRDLERKCLTAIGISQADSLGQRWDDVSY